MSQASASGRAQDLLDSRTGCAVGSTVSRPGVWFMEHSMERSMGRSPMLRFWARSMQLKSTMTTHLPELQERVLTNSDGEGQTFIRNSAGRIVICSGDGDYSNAGGWDCFWAFWDTGAWLWCALPI